MHTHTEPTATALKLKSDIESAITLKKVKRARDLHELLHTTATSAADRVLVHDLGNLVQRAILADYLGETV